jgi:hypothetical protein
MTKTSAPTPDYGRFEPAQETTNTRNILWSSQGDGGSGKTHFLLTAPDPIAVLLFDPGGLKGLMDNPLFKTKDIRVIDYSKIVNVAKLPEADRAQAAQDVLLQFEDDWAVAMSGAFRTVGLDKEDSLWELLQCAEETKGKQAWDFSPLNMRYRGWFAEAETAGVNFGSLCGMKEVWARGGPTGAFRSCGSKRVPELVQVCLQHAWDSESRSFKVTILDKCRLGEAEKLLGQTFESMDFLTLAMELFPTSDPSEWE